MDPIAELRGVSKDTDFFIGIDSDGCVFDSMEIKQKECFCPNFIKYYGLQVVSKYAREVWEFVNLYSTTRGCNRFLAVICSLDLLRHRREVKARNADIPQLPQLRAWIEEESKLGNPALKAKVDATGDAELEMIYAWSTDNNARVTDMVHGLPPFPGVADFLAAVQGKADAIVVSQTPLEALVREWEENKIDHLIKMIAGQEHGTKTEHLKYAASDRYDAERILMIGDAPGDYKAAKGNDAMFFPIVPGREEDSWARLNAEGLERFFNGTFAGEYQSQLLAAFDEALPENPPWQS
jgi:phosphoglycolate phosphatase-like HAD superfamily hydrolase